ncbi:GPP34 family phosphoprotein [Ornithinimicrobium sp. Arc0846-15]|nr:GPP34 family phosphoprotein [Ornithinimicrobium laminariae]
MNADLNAELLVVEDVTLLLLDDEKGTMASSPAMHYVLGGALLIELALLGRAEMAPPESRWKAAKVRSVPGDPLIDPLLADGFATLDEQPRGAQQILSRLGHRLQPKVSERLADRGLVERKESRIFGLFPTTAWPAADQLHEDNLRQEIEDALVRGLTPNPRTASIIALLSGANLLNVLVHSDSRKDKQVKQRAKAIEDGDWGASMVSDAVAAASAAIAASTAAAIGVAVSTITASS